MSGKLWVKPSTTSSTYMLDRTECGILFISFLRLEMSGRLWAKPSTTSSTYMLNTRNEKHYSTSKPNTTSSTYMSTEKMLRPWSQQARQLTPQ